MSEAKNKCRNSSVVLKETRTKNFRTINITIMQKTMWYFGTMHVTLRMTIMLSIVGALEKEGETLEPWLFNGKVENPWLEAKTKHVPELLVLKTEIKLFLGSATFQSTVNSKGLSISPMPTIFMLFCLHFCSLIYTSFDGLWCLLFCLKY